MRKLALTLSSIFWISVFCLAQAPDSIKYQAIVRNATGRVVADQSVGVQIMILKGSTNGTLTYSETHTPTTNKFGLINLVIGGGTTTNDFSAIDWSMGPYFTKVGIDPTGGADYSLIMGTSQLLSVPYALHAKTADSVNYIDLIPISGSTPGTMNYWNGNAWITIPPGTTGQVLTFENGVPTWTTSTITTLEDNDVYSFNTNRIWMDRNLGASQVATSDTDVASYGDLYQWGRDTDGHQLRTSGTTSTLSNTDTPVHGDFILGDGLTIFDWRSPKNDNLYGVNNPCPGGYRIPTKAEWEFEVLGWGETTLDGPFASPLKLPTAGGRLFDGSIHQLGVRGHYWSSTVVGDRSSYLRFDDELLFISAVNDNGPRISGYSIRCIKD